MIMSNCKGKTERKEFGMKVSPGDSVSFLSHAGPVVRAVYMFDHTYSSLQYFSRLFHITLQCILHSLRISNRSVCVSIYIYTYSTVQKS